MASPVRKNITYLTLSQAANYVLPLITIPYISRVVGPEKFGLIEFATVVMLYYVAVVEYSFMATVSRRMAGKAKDTDKINFLLNTAMQAKILLFFVALAVFVTLFFTVPEFYENAYLLWLAFTVVLGWALYPNFLFVGLQKLGVIASANVLIKSIAAALIFIFVNKEGHFERVVLINGVSQLGVGLMTLFYVPKIFSGHKWFFVRWRAVKAMIWQGRFIFVSNMFSRIYGFSALLIGGFLLTPIQLGVFAAASKLITVAQSFVFQPLQGALYPYLSEKRDMGMSAFLQEIKGRLTQLALLCALGTLGIIVFSPFMIKLLFGTEFQDAAGLAMIMAPMIFVGSFGHMYLTQGLLILREDKKYMLIVVLAGTLSIALNVIFINWLDLIGAALVKLTIEILIALTSMIAFYQVVNKAKNG